MLLRIWILLPAVAAAVFVEKQEANGVLQRRRRANSGFLEEMKQGNLERECVEELCDYEEAREVFEDDDKTKQFWMTYNRRDPCADQPCRNNGTCVSTETAYQCFCPEGFGGQDCEAGVEVLLKCLYQNGRCQHFCSGPTGQCSCADGYKLGADGRRCDPQGEYPCGRLVPQDPGLNQSMVGQKRLVGSSHCPRGACPWQVLVQLNGRGHCGGVLVSPDWVVTAAHCIHGNRLQDLAVVAGEHNLDVDDGTEQRVPVSMVMAHEDYDSATGDSDVAVMKLSRPVTLNRDVVPVCLPTRDLAQQELQLVRYHTVSGWGGRTVGGNEDPGATHAAPVSPILRRFSVPIVQNSRCSLIAGFNFSSNMLCAGYLGGGWPSCRGDDGSPLVTHYGSTHFLTGVVGWGRGCQQPGYYGVYANMANFVDWVKVAMETAIVTATETPASEMLEQKLVK